MRGPSRSGRERQRGYVSVYVALVTSLVLLPLVMVLVDLSVLAYWRTKLRNTADALAIGAVAQSRNFHIPIPTEFIGYFPVNGYLINAIHLSNLETGGWVTDVGPKLKELGALNHDRIGPQAEVRVGEALVLPLGNLVSPFMYVQVPVEAEVKPLTPFLGAVMGEGDGRIRLEARSCAVAWYRPDRWVHKWWDEDPDTLTDTLDAIINVTDEPTKYYRLTNCVDEGSDLADLAEVVITEHLELNPEAWQVLEEWMGRKPRSKEMERAREGMKQIPDRCGKGDPCVEGDRESIEEWGREESRRRRAEEEAERAREEAARRAAEGQGAP